MWRDYSAGFIVRNRASSIAIITGTFISALFLSLLCCLFFNFWAYEIERIVLEEGDWQGRITGEIDADMLPVIENFANVERVVLHEKLSGGQETGADIYFRNMRTIYRDMPMVTKKLGLESSAASYHELLLSRYMIYSPEDKEPPLLMVFYVILLFILSLSLILIIHNSFTVSMNARIHQFGIFSSVGATPGQIRACLMQEAGALCAIPVLLGSLLGIAVSFGIIQSSNLLIGEMDGRHEAVFQYHPLVFAVTILSSAVTALISAWLPAVKLSRLTPLQAIHNTDELSLKKKKDSRLLPLLFGVEGELAGNALRAQRRALRTSALSLTLSFLGFTIMLCFFTLSDISTGYTYFEKYQDVWDIMVTIKDTGIGELCQNEEIGRVQGIQNRAVYQKANAVCLVSEKDISEELSALGGPEIVTDGAVKKREGGYLVNAPVVIMDDKSFLEYCGQCGITARLDGGIVLNRIWDSMNSNFRYRKYLPYIKEHQELITLQDCGQTGPEIRIPALGFTQKAPALREEYMDYALVQFIPFSLWERISGRLGGAETDTYIRVLTEDGLGPAKLKELETEILRIIGEGYTLESENRVQEKITNDRMIKGYMLIAGGLCSLLAIIGIANVFSNTMGFLHQRKREFSRYLSVGMTPGSMRKMFCIEALVIAGRPLLITFPLTAAAVGFMIKASYLDPMEFLEKAPIMPIAAFALIVFAFVALAYYIGGRKILKYNLANALYNDSMM